jgi:SAM-dependent methyltransferase
LSLTRAQPLSTPEEVAAVLDRSPQPLRLNIGCGPNRLPGEVGVDLHPTGGADIIADLCSLPIDDDSADFVRLDHVLEHLPARTAVRALLEAKRVLRSGGSIRVGVPDLAATCRAYVEAETLADKAWILRQLYGSQAHDGEYHQAGWDKETLADLLRACGFVGIVVSDDPERDEGICIKAEAVKP